MDNNTHSLKIIISLVILVILVILTAMWGIPKYRIYKQDLAGQANLRQQEWEKKIAVEEARALKESAILMGEAEIERAKCVAEANKIIGDSLRNNEEYLRYLWIDGLKTNEQQVIYIPTEAGLPILEAGKRY